MPQRRVLRLIVLLLLAAATAGPTLGCAREPLERIGHTRSPPIAAPPSSPPPADARWWWAAEMLTRACMASKGFDDYRVTPGWSGETGPHFPEEWLAAVPDARRDRARTALFGDETAHTWESTGCYGRALHDLGTD